MDGFVLPVREFGGESYCIVLQNAQREGRYGMGSLDTTAIVAVNRDAVVVVRNVGDVCVEAHAWVAFLEELGCHTIDDGAEAARVSYQVIVVTEDVGGQVVARAAKDERAFQGGVAVLKVYDLSVLSNLPKHTCKGHTPFPPVHSLGFHIMLLRVPSPQRRACLRCLILQVFLEDLSGSLAGNFVGGVILVQQMRVVFVAVLVVGGDIVIIRVVGLQVVFVGLSCQFSID